MKILDKYVLREHLGPLAFALTALTSLLLLNYVAKQFGNLVGKGLEWSVIGEFFLLSIPFTVAMTLPMAVLVSVLYAYSRLASENEITALKASGVGMLRVLVPVLCGAAVIALGMVVFNDQLLPRANHRLRVLQGDIARKKPTFALREQVINEVSPGKLFLRAGHIEETSNLMREVTIYDLSDPTRRRTIYADSGNLALAAGGVDLELTLYDGSMQELPTSDPSQLQRLFYQVDYIRVRGVGNSFARDTADQYKSDREMSICEMQAAVDSANRNLQVAQHELEATLVGAVRTAATGAPLRPSPPPKSAEISGRPGLGRAYCTVLAALGGAPGGGSHADSATERRASGGADTAARRGGSGAARRAARAASAAEGVQVAEAAEAVQDSQSAEPPLPLPPGYEPPDTVVTRAIPLAQVGNRLDGVRARMEDAERVRDGYDVEIQKKFALATACVVFVLLGAPIALRFPRGGVGLTIGVSLGVFALYYIGLIAGEELANRDIASPFWAMWAANLLFTAVGILLIARMGREGSTARGGDMSELFDGLRTWVARAGRHVGLPLDRRSRAGGPHGAGVPAPKAERL